MNNCIIILRDANQTEIAHDTTDASDNYSLTNIPNGNYSIQVLTTKVPGGYNLFDVTMIRQFIAGLTGFSQLQQLAAE